MITVGLVQFCEKNQGEYYSPHTLAVLQAYAEKHSQIQGDLSFLPWLIERKPLERMVSELKHADIVGFSCYIWNLNLSLALAKALKAVNPHCLIVFGGPQVPEASESFLREHPEVDLCSYGEGEQTFCSLLEAYKSRDWSNVPGIGYLDAHNQYQKTQNLPRIQDLNQIPSPFLEGYFDPLFQAYPFQNWVMLWETNRGCPFSCAFCDWGSATASKVKRYDMERLKAEMAWFGKMGIKRIYCCDANFGIFKRDIELAEYIVETKQTYGAPLEFHEQTTKNASERSQKIHQILSRGGILTDVTLSLQSLDPTTLSNVKRDNISLQDYMNLQAYYLDNNISTYTDIIVGLPGETYDSFVNGLNLAIEQGQHNRLQIYNAILLPNAAISHPEYIKAHGITSVEHLLSTETVASESHQPIVETKRIIVSTQTLPETDWCKLWAFVWMMNLIYFFNRPLQMPILLLVQGSNLTFRQVFEAFSQVSEAFPVIRELAQFFQWKARQYQLGKEENCSVNLADYGLPGRPLWKITPDQFALLEICHHKRLDAFFLESWQILEQLYTRSVTTLPKQAIFDALTFNYALFKVSYMIEPNEPKFAFHQEPIQVQLTYNVGDLYQAALKGRSLALKETPMVLYKNWAGPPYGLKDMVLDTQPTEGFLS